MLELEGRPVKVPVGPSVPAQRFAQSSFLQVSSHTMRAVRGVLGASQAACRPLGAAAATCAQVTLSVRSRNRRKHEPEAEQRSCLWVPVCMATASAQLVPAGSVAAGEPLLMCRWPAKGPCGIPSACASVCAELVVTADRQGQVAAGTVATSAVPHAAACRLQTVHSLFQLVRRWNSRQLGVVTSKLTEARLSSCLGACL